MKNQIETVALPNGIVSYDHQSGHMKAIWDNGYEENWPRRGYSLHSMYAAFLKFTDQWDKYIEHMAQKYPEYR